MNAPEPDLTQNADTEQYNERPSSVPWPPLLLGGAIIGSFVMAHLAPLPWPGLDDAAARVIGLSIGALGLILIAWSAWTLRRAKTTFLPHAGSDQLVTSGPYHRFRNPIYIGDIMLLLGAAELTKNIWFVILAAAFGILVTWLAIIPEERHLEGRFGDAFREYKARSRRWL